MACLRFHDTESNTDWLVRWYDDEEQDTLQMYLGVSSHVKPPTVECETLHGRQRTAMLAWLARTQNDLAVIRGDLAAYFGLDPDTCADEEETHGPYAARVR